MKPLTDFETHLRALSNSKEATSNGATTPALVNATFSCPAFDPSTLFARTQDHQRIFWEQPDHDFALVAIGAATRNEAGGPDRFAHLRTDWNQAKSAVHTSPEDQPMAFPIALTALKFSPSGSDDANATLPSGVLIIPRLLFVRDGDQYLLNVTLQTGGDLESNITATREELDWLFSPASDSCEQMPPSPHIELIEDLEFSAWEKQVRSALAAIDGDQFEKVVLARTLRTISEKPFDLGQVLKTLEQRYAHCTVFAYGSEKTCFVGATPERLLRLQDRRVQIDCLAGSIALGGTPEKTKALAKTILSDPKELHEHAVVAQAVREILAPFCESIDAPSQPLIRQTADLQHLHTPLSAVAKPGSDIFDFIQQLHPTPATGGFPRQAALSFIEETESFDRGWYAGPCGWIDSRGNGDIAVAIRSALIEENQATLYAGSGIVAGSDPGREYEETALKLRTMLWALQAE